MLLTLQRKGKNVWVYATKKTGKIILLLKLIVILFPTLAYSQPNLNKNANMLNPYGFGVIHLRGVFTPTEKIFLNFITNHPKSTVADIGSGYGEWSAGVKYPGECFEMGLFSEDFRRRIRNFYHFLTPKTLINIAKSKGFIIEIAKQEETSIVLIANKP